MTPTKAFEILANENKARLARGATDDLYEATAMGMTALVIMCDEHPVLKNTDFEEDEEQ